ncbi:MAG: tripartite tricarboxylate transporter substrate binding protein [Pseudomonadota bacterium]
MMKFTFLMLAASVIATPVFAEFPDKDITLIVPWSAGGGTDTIARTLVADAENCLGTGVNVVNRTGAVGASGMGATSTARPDGYTIGLITFQLSAYQPMGMVDLGPDDFDLLQLINQSAGAITVSADSEWQTLGDLMTYATENPGVVTVGHSGTGGSWHLAAATVADAHGATFNYVPFDGSAKVRTALLGGHIAVSTSGADEVKQLADAGEVRILAVVADERVAGFPDVPTIAEAGYPLDAPIYDWRGLAAPKGLPDDVKAALVEGLKACFESESFQSMAAERAIPLVYAGPEGFEAFLSGMDASLRPALASMGLLAE